MPLDRLHIRQNIRLGKVYQFGFYDGGREDEEMVRAVEEEIVRVRAQRGRLSEMPSWEAREEELRRGVEARRATGRV
jgi:hypothetical protein